MTSNAGNLLNNSEFFADIVDKLKTCIEQRKKRECLKGAISKGKLLGGKKGW